jgi:hypothetical protein
MKSWIDRDLQKYLFHYPERPSKIFGFDGILIAAEAAPTGH